MKRASLLGLSVVLAGCAITGSYGNRLDYDQVSQARDLAAKSYGPIAIKWVPADFPQRVDTQGASGFVGSLSQTKIPIGAGLSNRVTEALDEAVGIRSSSSKVLTITVENAKSKFQYSAGIFNTKPTMDRGGCVLEATFSFGDLQWKETFTSSQTDKSVGGKTETGVVQATWDEIALQVAKSVVKHISGTTASSTQ